MYDTLTDHNNSSNNQMTCKLIDCPATETEVYIWK